jgi:hypothetical protein
MNKWKYKMVHFLQLIPVSKLNQKKKKKKKNLNIQMQPGNILVQTRKVTA